VWFSVRIP